MGTIAVIGDLILDEYVRICGKGIAREAPDTLQYDYIERHVELGGAAHVANALHRLGGIVNLYTAFGSSFNTMLLPFSCINFCENNKIIDYNKITRYYDGDSQIFRVNNINRKLFEHDGITDYFSNSQLDNASVIILSDYNLGVISTNIIKNLEWYANEYKPYLFMDSKVYSCIDNTSIIFDLISPNEDELRSLCDDYSHNVEHLAISVLKQKPNIRSILLKQGANGCYLVTQEYTSSDLQASSMNVHNFNFLKVKKVDNYCVIHSNYGRYNDTKIEDTIGAGDCVIAMYAMAQLKGFSKVSSLVLADIAGWLNATHKFTYSPLENEVFSHAFSAIRLV